MEANKSTKINCQNLPLDNFDYLKLITCNTNVEIEQFSDTLLLSISITCISVHAYTLE